MSNRRQFVGTLGKALGAVGLLLPWSGKGALALPADLDKAEQLSAPSVSPLVLKIREAIALARAAERADCEIGSDDKEGEAITLALVEQRHEELFALVDQIPDPPLSFEDSLIHAEVAHHFADKDGDGRLIINDWDYIAGPSARLIRSILQLGGRYDV
jgi:hypothetical protein